MVEAATAYSKANFQQAERTSQSKYDSTGNVRLRKGQGKGETGKGKGKGKANNH